eukprot:993224-Prorocentrum_minimum.AAC.1
MLTPPPRSVLFDSKARVMLEWEGGANFVFSRKLQVDAQGGRPQERSEECTASCSSRKLRKTKGAFALEVLALRAKTG